MPLSSHWATSLLSQLHVPKLPVSLVMVKAWLPSQVPLVKHIFESNMTQINLDVLNFLWKNYTLDLS